MSRNWKIWIDTGGTFTDCLAYDLENNLQRIKILSSGKLRGIIIKNDRKSLNVKVSWPVMDNIFNGYQVRIDGIDDQIFTVTSSELESNIIYIDRKLEELKTVGFEMFSVEEAPIVAVRLATKSTLIDPLPNIELRLGSTKGTNALLEKKGDKVGLIVTRGMHDLLLVGTQQRPDLFSLNVKKTAPMYSEVVEIQERVCACGEILTELDPIAIEQLIRQLKEAGLDNLAICLTNSYQNSIHEDVLFDKLKNAGFRYISTSSKLAQEIGILSRVQTTVVNAYLSRIIEDYLLNVKSKIAQGGIKVMTSAGGLIGSDRFQPKDSLLSGPAGGVVGSVHVANDLCIDKILTFDMGGTSTDVSRYAGKYDYKFLTEINHILMYCPALAIETVAAGGGSICSYDGYKLSVGPESAGAFPGPACYGNHGPLTITDINYLLGRIHNSNFSIPLIRSEAEKAFGHVKDTMNEKEPDEEILLGFLQVANETMAEAIRKISMNKGYDPSEYALLAFGGAGGQHACSVADLLKIKKVIIPFDAGLLSAYGMGHAEIERIVNKQLLQPLGKIQMQLESYFTALEEKAFEMLTDEGTEQDRIYCRNKLVYLRFIGQENAIEIEYGGRSIANTFRKAYEKLYGHWLENEDIEVESLKLIAAVRETKSNPAEKPISHYHPTSDRKIHCYVSDAWKQIPVFNWEKLELGAEIVGPALLMSNNSTVFIETYWSLTIETNKNAILQKSNKQKFSDQYFTKSTELELYTNRFKAVADDMGAILQRTSFSVNVKDRMDFSCAVLNSKGYLVANAPHIPVHLGSLGICVREVIKKSPMNKGDVIITNHPGFGGSHLPDITLVAPVYYEDEIIAFVCNRAHHAELGGITPGSMPANATSLEEEGVVIEPMHLVKNHKVQWNLINQVLSKSKYPTRALEENLADLKGALASIKAGQDGLLELCNSYGKPKVIEYMDLLLEYSSDSLLNTFKKFKGNIWRAEEYLDDSSKIKVVILRTEDEITFDFNGTSATHGGNLNANLAILNSAVIYVLRLMLEEPLPLNEGIMKRVQIKVPVCMLNPAFHEDPALSPAVVGGNTETSQRIVDTLIKAFKLAACSQGTMNNLIFGNDSFGFYETIGGGVGAGEGFNGADAVHQHMTNTRITDPEVMEFRYPVVVEEIGIRRNSGGKGRWKGGDGIVRKIRFQEDVILTILSQHRVERPFGMAGGSPGKAGRQVLVRSNGIKKELKGIETIEVNKGDAILIETPGGGGYGS